jgi:hypothetical protein
MVTWFEPSDAGTDTFDDTRTFVAEHDGQWHGVMLVAHVDVGLAEAATTILTSTSSSRGSSSSSASKVNAADGASTKAALLRI